MRKWLASQNSWAGLRKPGLMGMVPLATLILFAQGTVLAQQVRLPGFSGIPVTASSRPFGSRSDQIAAAGQVEREFLQTGTANVYAHGPDGTAVVRNPDVKYATRFIVRAPSDPQRFSGTEHRGAGVGGALLKKAATLAHERGCGRMEWTAFDWNVNAQRVYEQRLGAKRMSEWFLYRMTREELARYLSA